MLRFTNAGIWKIVFDCYREVIERKDRAKEDTRLLRSRVRELRDKYRHHGGRSYHYWIDSDGMDE
jgi:hypothetical protein